MLTWERRVDGVSGHLSIEFAIPSRSVSSETGSGAVTVMVTVSVSVSVPSDTVKVGR